jgi:hypothetical protein
MHPARNYYVKTCTFLVYTAFMKSKNLQKEGANHIDIINTLATHRKFAKECLFGIQEQVPLEICKVFGVVWIKEFDKIDELSSKECKSINFKTFSKLMKTDRVLYSFSEDVFIENFEI